MIAVRHALPRSVRALPPRASLRIATLCSPASTPYVILGIRPTASDDEIKAKFRALVKQHHPDLNHGSVAAAETTQQINEAFDSILQQRLAAQQQQPKSPVWQQPPRPAPQHGQEEQRRTPQPRTRQPHDRRRDEAAVQMHAKQRYAAQLRMRQQAQAEKAAEAEKAGVASAASQARLSAAAATAARNARRKAARKGSG